MSAGTGINANVLKAVDNFVQEQDEGIHYTELTKDSILVVCKNMTITYTLTDNLKDKLAEISEVHGEKTLYLVLDDCIVNHIFLPEGANIKVLDLRGKTKFPGALGGKATVEKVLIRNNIGDNKRQLWLSACGKLGPIYQLSTNIRTFSAARMLLSGCHLDDNFKFVNLNSCCTKLLTCMCLNSCRCPAKSRNKILESFDPDTQPAVDRLKGV